MRTVGGTGTSGVDVAAPALAALLAARVTSFTPHARPDAVDGVAGATSRASTSADPPRHGFITAVWPGASSRNGAAFLSAHATAEAHAEADQTRADLAGADLRNSVEPSAARQNAYADEIARARDEGFTAGFDAGRGAAEVELGAGVAELDRLAGALVAARAIDASALAAVLAQTVHTLLAELLDEHPDLTACGVQSRARDALDTMATPCVLWLAPADATALAASLARPGLNIVPDPTLARGALRLTNATSRLNDSPAARLDRLAPMLTEAALHVASLETAQSLKAA